MPRIRFIKPEFFKDEDLAALPYEFRLLFIGLWGIADKAGRLEDRPLRIKAELFPYDNIDIEAGLMSLSKSKQSSGNPFINRYITDKQRYIQITNWEKHQKPHNTEKESTIPEITHGVLSIESGVLSLDIADAIKPVVKQPLINGDLTVKGRLNGFIKPEVGEIAEYARGIGYNLDGQSFYDWYESNGWKVGKNTMKDWRAAVRTWKAKHPEKHIKTQSQIEDEKKKELEQYE